MRRPAFRDGNSSSNRYKRACLGNRCNFYTTHDEGPALVYYGVRGGMGPPS